ncbi:formylglycine-generating enzyme family protein [Aeoliella sp.]|uniref:formylglycine-generating enzyme family protein n=1 Tax=Aeoliella sp. TaxID=2795800 RepID=UPI003CCBD17D
MQNRFWTIVIIVLVAPLPIGIWAAGRAAFLWWHGPMDAAAPLELTAAGDPPTREHAGMIRIAPMRALVGDSTSSLADRQPAHEVVLDAYWVDSHAVTNDQFALFVAATEYVTTAERRGSSLVFDLERREWLEVDGAMWTAPEGPLSTLADRGALPVVHVSWDDAVAYARWAGKRLLTEAEYEVAARGGLMDNVYSWGNQLDPDSPLANYWQGRFPNKDLALDGFRGASPVGQFPPNRFGLYDMTGNVWCWCQDWYAADYYFASPKQNPTGPMSGRARVLRGGSWLSTGGASSELAVAARGHAPAYHTASNVGFRCASDRRPVEQVEVAAKSSTTR